MLRSCRILRAAHKPSIKFPDRKAPQTPHEPHPHPAAPASVVSDFSHFQEVFSSGPHFHPEKLQQDPGASASSHSSSSTGPADSTRPVFDDLHRIPERFWKTASLAWDEKEMEAVMSGGASLRS